MRTLNYILLSVADPARSEAFYTSLLGLSPIENSPTFVLYILANGMKLGPWIADDIVPRPLPAGGMEVTFSEADDAAVKMTFRDWSSKAKVLQEPHMMDFGYTFVLEDPDGHRIRIFAPPAR
ncbi:hypothetical protein VW35_12465 [Devosia soli]|uniref:VOC domain-containing protein n=1 Tax=Devosia soli TaxID=361041 RepID=A0A0F5L717_9HYPH|nr:VOC family protein [Devosia soli]KKB78128.1 hypothetical protein VW35_12465 [Devosia soli]